MASSDKAITIPVLTGSAIEAAQRLEGILAAHQTALRLAELVLDAAKLPYGPDTPPTLKEFVAMVNIARQFQKEAGVK